MDERQTIIDFLKRELIGPSDIDVDEQGNEILYYDAPHVRYISGILYPQYASVAEEDDSAFEKGDFEDDDEVESPNFTISETTSESNISEDFEEAIDLSNAYRQSAISMTFCCSKSQDFVLKIDAAAYLKFKTDVQNGKMNGNAYRRLPIHYEVNIADIGLPTKGRSIERTVEYNGSPINLSIKVFLRYNTKNGNNVYTISLINTNDSGNVNEDINSFYQVSLSVESDSDFLPIPETIRISSDEDYQKNLLLYRSKKKYGIGHGCSVDWPDEDHVKWLSTTFLPSYETRPVMPKLFPDLSLEMIGFSRYGNNDNIVTTLNSLIEKYGAWISSLENEASKLEDKYKKIANSNIKDCKECLNRLREGITILMENEDAITAFKYMNEAMLLQQLHYSIPKKQWMVNTDTLLDNTPLPDILKTETWGESVNKKGKWRPFQIAFILLNIKSIVDEFSSDHDNVELIWFPTGGGKTEAYLGLSAFTIFWKRINNKEDSGTDVLMRYTLRLLTSQQYERASALICACEYIRSNNVGLFGENEISIGMWVGQSTSPNKNKEAFEAFGKLYNSGKDIDNPFLITKCPWCGAEMGPSGNDKDHRHFATGYKVDKLSKRFFYACANPNCHFHRRLPMTIIDEEIYNNPPSLIIGTVDKFAMLPFLPQAQKIFGIYDGERKKHPSLIIQDELHLISGPLGSMVALYETMIGYLCSFEKNGQVISPKIVASTATISRAKEQCKNLYCKLENQIKIFPPSGIDANESFFATVDNDKANKGRKYVGVFAPGSPSVATTSIHTLSCLLQAPLRLSSNDLGIKDAYWTNVLYYNSLRELGQAATWINADILEYCQTISKRFNDGMIRYPNRAVELTSRMDSHKVQYFLDDLNNSLTRGNEQPIDICLATNMISVGLDVSRLGLMTVFGQPKTASEYIQATSRVGRGKNPGLVFTVYSPSKPRDKSIFENFMDFHSKMYTYVEPTSVTPFSPQLRDRALAAVVFGMLRLNSSPKDFNNPKRILQDEVKINETLNYILSRVSFVDLGEKENTKKQIIGILKKWKNQDPNNFCYEFNRSNSYLDDKYSDIPCFYPDSSLVPDIWNVRSNSVPTSMRNVDRECNVKLRMDDD